MARELVSVDDHLQRILDTVYPLQPYDQPLLEALDLPICEEVVSPIDLPGFDNSAMDGYAVRSEEVAEATESYPVWLPVVGESAAGQSEAFALSAGSALRIMTGAPVPAGADAIVPLEWTNRGIAEVAIHRAAPPGLHVRRVGEDIRAGQRLFEEGTVLGPREIGLLAAVGRAQVRARPRPRVVVISTGSELREPGTALGFDSVYDSNSHALAAAARRAGAVSYRVGIVSDDPHEFRAALSDQLVRADVVVTSGGVSKGDYDVVKEVLSKSGGVDFYDVAMKPGKPQGFGTVGEDDTPIFTLPGNPVSAYVSFEVFVLPAIRRLMGRMPYRRPMVRAISGKLIRSVPGKQQYIRAQFAVDPRGAHVSPVGGDGSHLIGDLAAANALIVAPDHVVEVPAGSHADVIVLDRDF
ncbi:MAG: molybdopterin molybdenumtransferase MoeA [Propionibacteriales bacterium]|nr:molybdopterin molybdenumtransferase MoeA [Propionibacteriales bacterium]